MKGLRGNIHDRRKASQKTSISFGLGRVTDLHNPKAWWGLKLSVSVWVHCS